MFENSSRSVIRSYITWMLASLFYFYDNLLQVVPNAMKPELSSAFNLTGEEFGNLTAYFLYAYGITQIPVGLLIDRFNIRYSISIASALCALGCFCLGLTDTLWMANLSRILMGIGAAFAFLSTLKVASHCFSSMRFPLMIGLTIMLGYLGSFMSLSITPLLITLLSWRGTFYFLGFLGMVLTGFLWLECRIKFKRIAKISLNRAQFYEVKKTLYVLLNQKVTWVAGFYACLMYVPTQVFGASFGIPFLIEAKGCERNLASFCNSFLYIGWMVGAPVWGLTVQRFNKMYGIMLGSTFCTFLTSVFLIYFQETSYSSLGIVFFFLGFFSSSALLIFAMVKELSPKYLEASAMGMTNAIISLSAIAPPVVGSVLDKLFKINKTDFAWNHYSVAFFIIPFSLFLALCSVIYLKPSFYACKTRENMLNKQSDLR